MTVKLQMQTHTSITEVSYSSLKWVKLSESFIAGVIFGPSLTDIDAS